VTGTRLADVANGLHDVDFEIAACAIADAQPRAIIRLGWEMNLSQMGWFAKGQEDDYIAAFRRVVGIFRRYSSEFKFDWCPGWGPQETPADLAYPGDDFVDYIGLDVYDFKLEGTAEERWRNFYLEAPFGLEWHRDFAARHGKLMSFPEWGVGQSGDNPFFIQQMHDWFVKHQDKIAYAVISTWTIVADETIRAGSRNQRSCSGSCSAGEARTACRSLALVNCVD
jgi:beta-mannanase